MLDFYKIDDSNLPPISEDELNDDEVLKEIDVLKNKLKNKLIILGHHYQQDDIIQFCDITGDSLHLARYASQLKDKEYVIFCGVHFMAETADILTAENQKIILPDLNAGCSMADMANKKDIEAAWKFFSESTSDKIIPITYINCDANLKSFVGSHDGTICTSSNAKKIIQWAFSKGQKLLFFPDQHLGRNTCFELGIKLNEMVVYNPKLKDGGLTKEQVSNAKVILWYGYCSVHQGFTVEQIKNLKNNSPETLVIVHPECNFDVVMAADKNGSTSYIVDMVEQCAKNILPYKKIAIGTEINLVNRLAKKYSNLEIHSLSPYQCLCTTMYRIRPRWLLKTLRSIDKNNPTNVIKVSEEVKKNSLIALDRMLSIS